MGAITTVEWARKALAVAPGWKEKKTRNLRGDASCLERREGVPVEETGMQRTHKGRTQSATMRQPRYVYNPLRKNTGVSSGLVSDYATIRPSEDGQAHRTPHSGTSRNFGRSLLRKARYRTIQTAAEWAVDSNRNRIDESASRSVA